MLFKAEDGIRAAGATGVRTAALPILASSTTGSFVGSPTCNYAQAVGSSSCTVVITSATPGKIGRASCRERVQVGVVGAVVRTDGMGGEVRDGCTGVCGKASNILVSEW